MSPDSRGDTRPVEAGGIPGPQVRGTGGTLICGLQSLQERGHPPIQMALFRNPENRFVSEVVKLIDFINAEHSVPDFMKALIDVCAVELEVILDFGQ